MFVYKITNLINNKSYIGQTIVNPESRWTRHKNDAIKNKLDTHFARAIRKYGVENFKLEIIDTATTQEELTQKEHDWIIYYDSIENGYNETSAISKSGGNTYKSKTEEELMTIGEKIRNSKTGGKNINATPVKCRNIETKEEFFFDSQAEMQKFFNTSNHIFISRRCLGKIKKPYLNLWEIAYADRDYGQVIENVNEASSINKNNKIKKEIIVKKLSTNEEKIFNTYAEAERYFNLKKKSLSAKASKKPQTFIYKEEYQVTKNFI